MKTISIFRVKTLTAPAEELWCGGVYFHIGLKFMKQYILIIIIMSEYRTENNNHSLTCAAINERSMMMRV